MQQEYIFLMLNGTSDKAKLKSPESKFIFNNRCFTKERILFADKLVSK